MDKEYNVNELGERVASSVEMKLGMLMAVVEKNDKAVQGLNGDAFVEHAMSEDLDEWLEKIRKESHICVEAVNNLVNAINLNFEMLKIIKENNNG